MQYGSLFASPAAKECIVQSHLSYLIRLFDQAHYFGLFADCRVPMQRLSKSRGGMQNATRLSRIGIAQESLCLGAGAL